MTRDMEKTAEIISGKMINEKGLSHYDMNSQEITRLFNLIDQGEWYKAISTAFEYGFVLGHRATVAGKVTKRL